MRSLLLIKNFLTKKDLNYSLIIITLIIFSNFAQLIGIGSIIPVINLIFDIENDLTKKIYNYYEFFFGLKNKQDIVKYSFLIFSFFLIALSQILYFLNIHFSTKLSLHLHKKIQINFFKFYNKVDFKFYLNKSISQIFSNFKDGLERISDIIVPSIITILMHSSMAVIIFIMMLYVNIKITLSSLLAFMIVYFIYFYLKHKNLEKISEKTNIFQKKKTKFLFNIFQNIKITKFLYSPEYINSQFEDITDKNNKIAYNIRIIESLPKILIEIIIFNLILLYLFFYINQNKEIISYNEIIFFGVVCTRLLPVINNIGYSYTRIKSSIKTFDLFTDENKLLLKIIFKGDKKKNIINKIHNIKTNNISFKYPDNKKIKFKNLNINLSETVCLFGKSGIGKTTYADILAGLLSPSTGNVLYNSINLKDLNYENLSNKISYISQNFSNHLDGSIEKIITSGNKKKKNLNQVLSLTYSNEFISKLKNKEKSVIGENGIKLSGGQMQRIALARAIYKKPELLILDEATNALDNNTEDKVIKNLKKLNIIIIIITHNHKLLKHCDQVIKF